MFSIISNIIDYFYINNPIEDNKIQSIEEESNLSDYEVICKILEKELCPDLSKSIEEIKEALFLKIFHEKISSQNVAKVFKIVDSLPDNRSKDLFYKDICEVYLQKNNFDQALYTTTFIKDEYITSKLLQTLSLDLFEKGRVEEALKIANLIYFDSRKAFVLKKICIAVASKNPFACFKIIDCFPKSEQSCKDDTLTELMFFFGDRAENAKRAHEKLLYSKLTLQFGEMLEYHPRFPIKI